MRATTALHAASAAGAGDVARRLLEAVGGGEGFGVTSVRFGEESSGLRFVKFVDKACGLEFRALSLVFGVSGVMIKV